jgi:hypothetical protein
MPAGRGPLTSFGGAAARTSEMSQQTDVALCLLTVEALAMVTVPSGRVTHEEKSANHWGGGRLLPPNAWGGFE